MRKALGLLFAASLLTSVGVSVASPVGAAAKGPTCKAFSATETTSPGLPIIGNAKKVNATVKIDRQAHRLQWRWRHRCVDLADVQVQRQLHNARNG